MSLNEPLLSPAALRILVGNSLYSIGGESAEKPIKKLLPQRKDYLVLLREEPREGDSQHLLLQGILNACKIVPDKLKVLSSFRHDADAHQLKELYQASFVILFGIEPGDIRLPVHFPYFQPQQHDGVTYLSSPGLADLENDKGAKKQLWESLRKALSL